MPSGRISLDGNSLSDGYTPPGGSLVGIANSWFTVVQSLLGYGSAMAYQNYAVAGQPTSKLLERGPTNDAWLAGSTGPTKTAIGFEGTNDIHVYGAPVRHAFERTLRWGVERRAAGAKVILATILQRGDDQSANGGFTAAQFEPMRQEYNALLRAWKTTCCDVLVDFDTDPIFGTPGIYNDPDWYQPDRGHLVVAGQARLASIGFLPAIQSLAL